MTVHYGSKDRPSWSWTVHFGSNDRPVWLKTVHFWLNRPLSPFWTVYFGPESKLGSSIYAGDELLVIIENCILNRNLNFLHLLKSELDLQGDGSCIIFRKSIFVYLLFTFFQINNHVLLDSSSSKYPDFQWPIQMAPSWLILANQITGRDQIGR